jgi:hypothetical protein
MEHWRQKAVDVFPEKAREFSHRDLTFSVYDLFSTYLIPMWEASASTGDTDVAHRIILMVEWSLNSSDSDVYNAINVSFLEHIPDKEQRLRYAEKVLPQHLYKRSIELSAALRKRNSEWRSRLEQSVSRYNVLHETQVEVEWPQ